jgi:hypothetical protein
VRANDCEFQAVVNRSSGHRDVNCVAYHNRLPSLQRSKALLAGRIDLYMPVTFKQAFDDTPVRFSSDRALLVPIRPVAPNSSNALIVMEQTNGRKLEVVKQHLADRDDDDCRQR